MLNRALRNFMTTLCSLRRPSIFNSIEHYFEVKPSQTANLIENAGFVYMV